jgi:hypothetical protein
METEMQENWDLGEIMNMWDTPARTKKQRELIEAHKRRKYFTKGDEELVRWALMEISGLHPLTVRGNDYGATETRINRLLIPWRLKGPLLLALSRKRQANYNYRRWFSQNINEFEEIWKAYLQRNEKFFDPSNYYFAKLEREEGFKLFVEETRNPYTD